MKPALLFAFAAFTSVAVAQQKTEAQKAIEKQVATYAKGMEGKDLRSVIGIFAPTFSAVDHKGVTHNRDRVVIQLKSLFASAKKIHVATTITSFKLEKGQARLTAHDVLDVDVPDGRGKLMKYRADSVSDEIWVPLNATWKIKSSRTVNEKQTLDGKPVGG